MPKYRIVKGFIEDLQGNRTYSDDKATGNGTAIAGGKICKTAGGVTALAPAAATKPVKFSVNPASDTDTTVEVANKLLAIGFAGGPIVVGDRVRIAATAGQEGNFETLGAGAENVACGVYLRHPGEHAGTATDAVAGDRIIVDFDGAN